MRKPEIADGVPTKAEVETSAKRLKGGRSGGPVGNVCRGLEGVAAGGNTQEGDDKDMVGALGKTITAKIRGLEPTRGSCMGNNGIREARMNTDHRLVLAVIRG